MKILVINYRDRLHPAAGGAEKHLHQIFSRIVQQGHEVVLLATSFKEAPAREVVDGIQVIRSGGDFFFQLTVARNLKKLQAEFNFDIVYEDLNKLPLFGHFWIRKPHLVQIHHLWRGSIFKEASFITAFGVWFFETIIPLFYRKSSFVAVSPSTVNELVELGIGKERISLVYNGADGLPFGFTFPEQKENYFLWLSRVHRYKGIFTALDAFKIFLKKYPESGMKLRVAGEGPLLPVLPGVIEKSGLTDDVVLEGCVSSDYKRNLLAKAFCLLQTSYKEGWGLTVIEAAECGTTTIASNVAGLCDSVIDGKTGILFSLEPHGPEACALAMEKMYLNPDMRKSLETEAKKNAAKFSWDRAAEETLVLLKKVAGVK